MIILYSLIAIFIAWIWIDYYRLVDIYGKEDLKYVILAFVLGGSSTLLVVGVDKYVLSSLAFKPNGEMVNDFLYYIFRIGIVEELAKSIPFFILLLIFRKQFREPIDYVAFISICALGFSAVENVMYFNDFPTSISMRAILSSVGHMCYTSLIAYALILMKFKNKKLQPFLLIGFILLAAFSHCIYDFLIFNAAKSLLLLILILIYFFLLISVFATILNNALNNSSNFTYKKVVNSDKIATRLILYYAIIFILQFFVIGITADFLKAFQHLSGSVYIGCIIIVITCIRLSQLKLIQNRWQPLKLELPFTIINQDPMAFVPAGSLSTMNIKIKGETYSENRLGVYYNDYFTLCPLSKSLHIEKNRVAYVEKKIFLKNDETLFVAKVYYDEAKEKFEYILLKPKIKDKILAFDKYPIVALLKISDISKIEDVTKSSADFPFLEWGYVKPLESK